MNEVLKSISDFVDRCLGPLGTSGSGLEWLHAFLIQITATILLFIAVKYFLWKPINNFLESKKELVDKELSDAKKAKENAISYEESAKDNLEKAKEKVKEMIADAVKTSEARGDEIINDAKAEAKKRLDSANQQIELEIKKQKQDIKDAIVDVAFLAASKIVGKEVDKNKYLSLVEEIIEGKSNE